MQSALEQAWGERQEQMESWYADLITAPERASRVLANDYEPFPSSLFSWPGPILDIGGGAGLVRQYLPAGTTYISLDPSVEWLRPEWTSLRKQFPCLADPFPFVRGVGESLPFGSDRFKTCLSLWSLNHARRPEQVFQEVDRVLQTGGTWFVVLEDMVPRVRDIPNRLRFALSGSYWTKAFLKSVYTVLRTGAWPLQEDHIRIRESDLHDWSSGRFDVRQRRWFGNYLAYEFRKP